MKKEIKGFLIIFLILCTMPLSSYADNNSSNLSMNEILKTSLDVKVNQDENFTLNVNNSTDIIMEHIVDIVPNITNGEVNAIYTMMCDQFDSEFGNCKLKFYHMYLNNSTEYPVDGLPYTARELYESKDSIVLYQTFYPFHI